MNQTHSRPGERDPFLAKRFEHAESRAAPRSNRAPRPNLSRVVPGYLLASRPQTRNELGDYLDQLRLDTTQFEEQ